MLTSISLFTGLGGLDFGFSEAGFRTAVAVESESVCCGTIRLNRRWPVLEGDVNTLSSRDILRTAGLKKGDADILIGGPPCQPFSKSGYWSGGDSGRLNDPRADTLTAFLRVLRDTKPETFLLENVRGLAYQNKDEGLRYLLDGIQEVNRQAKTNYSARWAVLNAADYGVPQLRERVFVIGSRDGKEFVFPQPTHSSDPSADLFLSRKPYATAWDALGDLPQDLPELQVGGKWGALLPTIPEGENYLWHTDRKGGVPIFGWRTRYWSFLLKLAKNKPSWTIQAQPGTAVGPFHWRNRRLSAEELCRLQTFPDGIRFECGRTEIQRMLGNAVPSLLAEILAREIKVQLLGRRKSSAPPKLAVPARGSAPPRERVRPVPKIYEALIGDHAAHPGTGQGPARRGAVT